MTWLQTEMQRNKATLKYRLTEAFQKRYADLKGLGASINNFLDIHLYIFSINKRIILSRVKLSQRLGTNEK